MESGEPIGPEPPLVDVNYEAGTEMADEYQSEEEAVVVEVAPNVARVRIRGLPRKKNIVRDLKSAFKGFHSIVNISPAVLGNKKTRDPVCKGFAFIDFVSDQAADKFVQKYSKQNVFFGRVQKEIICDVVARFHSCNPDSEKVLPTNFQQEISTEQNLDISTHDLEEQDPEENYKRIATEDQPSSLVAGATVGVGYFDESSLINEESSSLRNGEKAAESGASKQRRKGQMASKKNSMKTKPDKSPKFSMLRSAARLKVKERAVLTGVLSKYGEGAVPPFSELS
ncbi:hypothetical protein Taro_046019 [Colocasia esculenta]|uniref:RRM domain-containing protein n=1 Tax=Colocasia esculenta TaxID=4460 RepID=A0A843WY02_COLES|nr:hypothetical protein [Colocasia esculenta]